MYVGVIVRYLDQGTRQESHRRWTAATKVPAQPSHAADGLGTHTANASFTPSHFTCRTATVDVLQLSHWRSNRHQTQQRNKILISASKGSFEHSNSNTSALFTTFAWLSTGRLPKFYSTPCTQQQYSTQVLRPTVWTHSHVSRQRVPVC